MGKRIIQQHRGRGTMRYRARGKAYRFKIGYLNETGRAKVVKLLNSSAHSAPLAKILINAKAFYTPACKHMHEGQEIIMGVAEVKEGNILALKDIPIATRIFNIETFPGNGGRLIRTGGSSAMITKKSENRVVVSLPSKKEISLDERCRATVGIIAGHGRLDKPMMKAGKKFYMMKARNKLWPRTSAVKMNVVDHPFGSGRGKNLAHGQKGKIPKNNAPPGALVGTIHPRRTGRRKR